MTLGSQVDRLKEFKSRLRTVIDSEPYELASIKVGVLADILYLFGSDDYLVNELKSVVVPNLPTAPGNPKVEFKGEALISPYDEALEGDYKAKHLEYTSLKYKYINDFEMARSIMESIIDASLYRLDMNVRAKEEILSQGRVWSNRIFVVHGHDEASKQAVARLLEKLGLSPVILHEESDKGQTIIEKLHRNSDVGYAVVLLTPDDDFGPKKRARQNVIFELGFFIGVLGRERVSALVKSPQEIEVLSDYQGVLYTAFDDAGAWQLKLAKELRAVGYNIDLNLL